MVVDVLAPRCRRLRRGRRRRRGSWWSVRGGRRPRLRRRWSPSTTASVVGRGRVVSGAVDRGASSVVADIGERGLGASRVGGGGFGGLRFGGGGFGGRLGGRGLGGLRLGGRGVGGLDVGGGRRRWSPTSVVARRRWFRRSVVSTSVVSGSRARPMSNVMDGVRWSRARWWWLRWCRRSVVAASVVVGRSWCRQRLRSVSSGSWSVAVGGGLRGGSVVRLRSWSAAVVSTAVVWSASVASVCRRRWFRARRSVASVVSTSVSTVRWSVPRWWFRWSWLGCRRRSFRPRSFRLAVVSTAVVSTAVVSIAAVVSTSVVVTSVVSTAVVVVVVTSVVSASWSRRSRRVDVRREEVVVVDGARLAPGSW